MTTVRNPSTARAIGTIIGNMVNVARQHPFLAGMFLGSLYQAKKKAKAEKKRRKGASTTVVETTAYRYKKSESTEDLLKAWFGESGAHSIAAEKGWATRRAGKKPVKGKKTVGGLFTGEVTGTGVRRAPKGLPGLRAHARYRVGEEASRAALGRYIHSLHGQMSEQRKARYERDIKELERDLTRGKTYGGYSPRMGEYKYPSMPKRVASSIVEGTKAIAAGAARLPKQTALGISRAVGDTIRMSGVAAKDASKAAVAGMAVGLGKTAQDRVRRIPALSWLNIGVDPAKFQDTVDFAVARATGRELQLAGKIMDDAIERADENPFLTTMYPEWREAVAQTGLGWMSEVPGAISETEAQYAYPWERGGMTGIPAYTTPTARVMPQSREEMLSRLIPATGAGEVGVSPVEAAIAREPSHRRLIEEREAEKARKTEERIAGEKERARRAEAALSPELKSIVNQRAKLLQGLRAAEAGVKRLQGALKRGTIKPDEYERKLERVRSANKGRADQLRALRGRMKDIERGQVLCKPGSITPHTEFDGEIYILTKEEGGRHTPFFKGYKPQFYIRTCDITGDVALPEGTEMVMPGDTVKLGIKLIAPIALEEKQRFAIREGGKTVGAGVVTKINK